MTQWKSFENFRGKMRKCWFSDNFYFAKFPKRIHFPLTTVCYFDNGYVGKQPVAWNKYCAEYLLKELQESMDRFSGCRGMIQIRFKMALNTHTINQSAKICKF